MRVAACALTLCLAVGPALAQAPKAAPPGRPAAAAAPKKADDLDAGSPANERRLLQFDLARTGDDDGRITGTPGKAAMVRVICVRDCGHA
jgi:hypothetical protein